MRRPMPASHLFVLPILVLIPLISTASHAANIDTNTLAREVERLGALVDAPDLGKRREQLQSIHQQAVEALEHGHVHWALHRLQAGLVLSASFRFLVEQKEVTDFAAFEKIWQAEGRTLEQARRAGRNPACQQAPSQVRALVERAANRAQRHYHASRPMARAADAPSGLFYLGRARAEVELTRLCEVFRVAENHIRQPTIPALVDEHSTLEEATDLAYEVPGAAIDQHQEFIELNASLKEFAELNDAGLRFGALDRFLAVTLRLSLLETDSPETPTSLLFQRIDQLTAGLTADGRDHSIALSYLENAVSALGKPDAEDRDRIAAERIVHRVLPVYLSQMGLTNP